METLNAFLEFELINFNEHSLTVLELVSVLTLFLLTKLILWFIKKALHIDNKFNKLDKGSLFALYQLIKYIIWVVSIAIMLETIGVRVTLLLAGSAALLVGVGLGLQQTFNDILSGIILLIEHSVKVGDILEIDGDIVVIQEIGLRTSKGMNRFQIVLILPNSLITTSKVINWSHQTQKTLFSVDVGVSYGTDVDLVSDVLKESLIEHTEIHKNDFLDVRFVNFGPSSLDFQLLFYSKNIFFIERIKSDLRKIINRKFIKNKISIPFPQLDVHINK
jgi:small-conductance mechanosensitive channel